MSNSRPVTYAVAGIAAVLIAAGAYSLGHSNSTDSGTAAASAAAQVPQTGQVPQQGGQLPDQSGQQPPQGGQLPSDGRGPSGFGTPVTGAAANKARTAALAKHHGTVERVMRLDDGSYVVHVVTANGELHVRVSKAFKVTGADQGGPGSGSGPAAGAQGTTS
jgi:hypothetical protein